MTTSCLPPAAAAKWRLRSTASAFGSTATGSRWGPMTWSWVSSDCSHLGLSSRTSGGAHLRSSATATVFCGQQRRLAQQHHYPRPCCPRRASSWRNSYMNSRPCSRSQRGSCHHGTVRTRSTSCPGPTLVAVRPYCYAHAQKAELEKQCTVMLQSEVIRPSMSAFSAPVHLIKKVDGS
jgi:hypothetical protein